MIGSMHNIKYLMLLATAFLLSSFQPLSAQAPVVANVRFEQRTDGSLLVDIYYDVSSGGGLQLDISVEASDDGGKTWTVPCTSLTGDVGEGIIAGVNKHIVWDFHGDNPGTSGDSFRVRVIADQKVIGQTITEDFTLTEDLSMPSGEGYAIRIGAPYITLDLGGHTITGDLSNGHQEGIQADYMDGITIRNGILDGFGGGVSAGYSDSITIEHMTIRNLDIDDPAYFLAGIVVGGAEGILIRDCYFKYLPVAHKAAIHVADCGFVIDHIEMVDGSLGVDISGDFDGASGLVSNSVFRNNTISGILVQNTKGAEIRNNEFDACEVGIEIDALWSGRISGLFIDGNDIHNCTNGILSYAGIESTISNNIVKDCRFRGITMGPQMGCGANPEEECFFSTGNLIENNVATGSFVDLYHHEECLGNTWVNNTCENSEGAEIPPCIRTTATAKAAFDQVDSLAKEYAPDGRLLKVIGVECDSAGESYKWYYVYQSDGMQSRFEVWHKSGEILLKDTVSIPWDIDEADQPFTDPWMDSDAALMIANSLGGSDFMETSGLRHIDMRLTRRESWFYWSVCYLSEDDVFCFDVDAALK
jgi:hypothetical protein